MFSFCFLCSLLFSLAVSAPSPPEMFVLKTTVFIGAGGETVLPCDYDGELNNRVSGAVLWYHEPVTPGASAQQFLTVWHHSRNQEPLVKGAFVGKVRLAPSDRDGKAALEIMEFDATMIGHFKCEVYYEDATEFSERAMHDVKLAHLGDPILQSGESPVKVIEGKPVSLACSVDAFPRPSIAWKMNGDRIDRGVDFPGDNNNNDDDKKKKRYVSTFNLTPKRKHQGMEIKCIVDGPAISTVPSRAYQWPNGITVAAALEVRYPPDEPYITLEDSQWFYEGTVLALGCTVADRGFPPATIRLTFPNSRSVETKTDSVVHNSFRLSPVYDQEKVICEAVSPAKELIRRQEKTLKVAFGPDAVEIFTGGREVLFGKVDAIAGQLLSLNCLPRAVNPEAEIHWSGAGSETRIVNETRLLVTPTWRQNGAVIRCLGRNPYYYGIPDKDVKAFVTLNVLHKPVWNASNTDQSVVKSAGQEALLTCGVTANPDADLKYYWQFDGKHRGMTREIKVRASASTFGAYTCVATNSIGSASFSVSLIDADVVAAAAAATERLVVGVVVAALLLIVVVVLLVCWSRRRKSLREKEEEAFRNRRAIPEIHEDFFRFGPSSPAAAAAAAAVAAADAASRNDDAYDDDTPPNASTPKKGREDWMERKDLLVGGEKEEEEENANNPFTPSRQRL